MSIKPLFYPLLCFFLVQNTFAADESTSAEPEKSNARAYRAHLLSFIWPSKMSSEQVDYQNIYQIDDILRFKDAEEAQLSTSIIDLTQTEIDEEINPFAQYQALIDNKVTILSNQTWPMIFEEQGSINFAAFHSESLFDGYPELTGQFQVKLGRYLETRISYQHYLFDSFTAQVPEKTAESSSIFDDLDPIDEELDTFFGDELEDKKVIKLYEPALLLAFEVERKTASKKLNYLDHPIIGSLLYFEPISVDDAEHELMLQALTEEDIVRDAEASISFDSEEEVNLESLNIIEAVQ